MYGICRLTLVSLVLLGFVGNSFGAFSFTWSEGTYAGTLWDSTELTDYSGTADWLFEVVVDVGGTTDLSALSGLAAWDGGVGYNQADDVVISSANWTQLAPGSFGYVSKSEGVVNDAYRGKDVYIRFWNDAGGSGAATEVGFIYDTTGLNWVTPAVNPSATITFDRDNVALSYLGGTGTKADGWSTTIAVPEPGTMALFAIGMLTVAARRRRK